MTPIDQYALGIYSLMPSGVPMLALVGGGCFRSFYDATPVKDFDLFFNDHGAWLMACAAFREDARFTETTKPTEETFPSFQDNAGNPPFNLIGFRFHLDAYSLSRSFDFTCCAFAAQMFANGLVSIATHPMAIHDASNKLLVFQNKQHIDRVARRRARYYEYGYTDGPGFIAGLEVCRTLPRSTSGGDYP